jgi:hypothetical protein
VICWSVSTYASAVPPNTIRISYITGTWANSFSEVTLKAPRQVFVVGTPYPVGFEAVPEGTVRLIVPAVE